MKNLMKAIFNFIVRLWSKIFDINISQGLKRQIDKLYTIWIGSFIKEIGENTLLSYPIRLEGDAIKRIQIGDGSHIQSNCVLGCRFHYGQQEFRNPQIIIGKNCSIGEYCHISAIEHVIIGDGLLTGRFVFIGDNSHGELSLIESLIPPANRKLISKGGIRIGENVWIGDKSSILSGVSIGDNVIVGANSVVTHDIPSNCLVCGSPAKIVKILDETC